MPTTAEQLRNEITLFSKTGWEDQVALARDAADEIERLTALLTDCANRLERALVLSGTDAEYAAIAVEQYRGKP